MISDDKLDMRLDDEKLFEMLEKRLRICERAEVSSPNSNHLRIPSPAPKELARAALVTSRHTVDSP